MERVLGWMLGGLLGALMVGGCRDADSPVPPASPAPVVPPPRTFAVTGVVTEVVAAKRAVKVRHEEIPGFMAAMTMPFDVKDTNELAGLQPGDRIEFRLLVTETEGWIDGVKRVGRAAPAAVEARGPRRVRDVEPLAVGDPLPDYPFTNQLGQRFSLGQFRGQALGLTFIFTRCPYPNFCPRISANFAAAAQQLAALAPGPTNWHLLSVSFDPEHDTPSVLHTYAARYPHDPGRWTLATGDLQDIDAITEQFGMYFGRDGESFSHNIRTVVVDARGRVHHIFPGNEWSVTDFVASLAEAAAVRD